MTHRALAGLKGRRPPPAARVTDAPFEWSEDKLRAATLIAEGSLSLRTIAADLGIDRVLLWRWTWRAEFQARVAELEEELNGDAFRLPLSRKRDRLHAYQARHDRLQQIVAERAAWFAAHEPEVPGGRSGYLIRKLKVVGTGPTAYTETEYEVDTGLVKAMGDLEKQAAIEVGEWAEKVDATVDVRLPAASVVFNLQPGRNDKATDVAEGSYREVAGGGDTHRNDGEVSP